MKFDEEDELRNLRTDLERKQIYLGGPKKVSEMLAVLMARRGYAQIETTEAVANAWRDIVGVAVAKDSIPGNIFRGVLEITVRNSVLLQELTFQKKQLTKKLLTALPDHKIKDLKFKIGTIS